MSENRVCISGNLSQEPKFFSKGAACSVAVSDDYVKDGQQVRRTHYLSVKAWNTKDVEVLRGCKKGDHVVVVGKLTTGSYEKEGRKIYTTDIESYRIYSFAPPVDDISMAYDHAAAAAGECAQQPVPGAQDVEIPF